MKVKDIVRVTSEAYIEVRSQGIGIWFGNNKTINECKYLECEIINVYLRDADKNVISVEVGRVDYD